jgi:hypothetical protein
VPEADASVPPLPCSGPRIPPCPASFPLVPHIETKYTIFSMPPKLLKIKKEFKRPFPCSRELRHLARGVVPAGVGIKRAGPRPHEALRCQCLNHPRASVSRTFSLCREA